MIARCGCRRARPPHPDVSVALRMRGRRLCHSNRSVNGSNGNGGCLQCRRGRLAGRALGLQAWRPAERALGWPGAWGEAEPGRPWDLAVAGEGRHEDRACSGMGGTGAAPRARRGGRGWGTRERRSLRVCPRAVLGDRLWRCRRPGAAWAAPRSGALRGPGLLRAGLWPEQPGHGMSRPEGSPVLGALAEARQLWPVTVPWKRGISGIDQSSGESGMPSYKNLR